MNKIFRWRLTQHFLCRSLTGRALDHISLPPGFESQRWHIWRVFHLWLRFVTFGSRSAHLAYHVYKSGRKTSIIIIKVMNDILQRNINDKVVIRSQRIMCSVLRIFYLFFSVFYWRPRCRTWGTVDLSSPVETLPNGQLAAWLGTGLEQKQSLYKVYLW